MFAEPLQQVGRTRVRFGRRKLIYFAGCDYLRMASDPRVLAAVERTLHGAGLNVAASRKTTGNHPLYEKVEQAAARFFGAERAVLVSNGYLTNLAAAQALRERIDHVLMDERAHASLQDAAGILSGRVERFAHRDAGGLGRALARVQKGGRVAILTDGMFAHDGSLAPLADYRRVAPSALLWVDDAHGAGVLGARGGGSVEVAGVKRGNLLQTVTFSKAFGVYGGAILASGQICELIVEKSGIVTGNTPLPLPLAGGVLESLRILRGTALRKRLWSNIRLFHKEMDRPLPEVLAPVIPLVPKSSRAASVIRERLLQNGIHPPLIQYPGGTTGGYFRFALSSEHTPEEISLLAGCLREA